MDFISREMQRGEGSDEPSSLFRHEVITFSVIFILFKCFRLKFVEKNIEMKKLTPGRSNLYNGSLEYSYGGYRCLILSRLAISKGFILEHGDSALEAAPAGYDHVIGLSGDQLQHEDIVIYRDHAALPLYLIIYKYKEEEFTFP